MPVSLDFGSRFKNCTSYELMGNWPAGLSIDSNGLVTGTPTAQGHYPNLYVKGSTTYTTAKTNLFAINVTAFGALVPDFNGEMKGVAVGTGDLTTTHTSTLYAPDFEGVYRLFGANEAVWSGGRYGNNFAGDTDFSNSSYWLYGGTPTVTSGISDPDGGNNAQTITATGGQIWIQANSKIPEGSIVLCSMWLRRRTGTGIIKINTGADDVSAVDVQTELTGTWQRIVAVRLVGQEAIGQARMGINIVTAGDEVDVYQPLWENVSGRANTLIPGDFIENSTEANITKCYANQNGNSIDGGTAVGNGTVYIVTEAVGTPLAELPYLQYYPAAQNDQIYSRDLTNAVWTKSESPDVSYDQVGITGEPNTASLCLDNRSSGIEFLYTDPGHADSTNTNTAVFWIKKDVVQTNWTGLTHYYNGGTGVFGGYALNRNTGAITARSSNAGGNPVTEVIDEGDWWKLLIQLTDNGSTHISKQLGVYPAVNDDGSATWGGTSTGSCIVGNIELHLNKTLAEVRGLGPIFTTTAAVATDAVENTFDLANHDTDNGAYYIEWIHSASSVEDTRRFGLISTSSAGEPVWRDNSLNRQILTYAPTIYSATFVGYDAGVKFKAAAVYSSNDSLFSACNNGTYSNDTGDVYSAYRLGLGKISICDVGVADTNSAKFNNLRRYDITSYQDGKDKIDDLMEPGPKFDGGNILDLTTGDS